MTSQVDKTLDGQAEISQADAEPVVISVVMPCLNEERSVGLCVEKAREGIRLTGLKGEVIVCDNGSVDGSVAAARGSRCKGRSSAAARVRERISEGLLSSSWIDYCHG